MSWDATAVVVVRSESILDHSISPLFCNMGKCIDLFLEVNLRLVSLENKTIEA